MMLGATLASCLALGFAPPAAADTAQGPAAVEAADEPKGVVVDVMLNLPLTIIARPGIGATLRFSQRESRVLIGTSFQAGRLPDFSKSAFFEASIDTDELVVDWDYAIALDVQVDYFRFKPRRVVGGGALWAQASLGYETWDVQWNRESARVHNGFVTLAVGVRWFPFRVVPVFIRPGISGIVLFGQQPTYVLGDEVVRLRHLAWNPGLVLGYRFR